LEGKKALNPVYTGCDHWCDAMHCTAKTRSCLQPLIIHLSFLWELSRVRGVCLK